MVSYPLLELTGSAEELEIATALLHEHGCLGTEEPDDASSLRAYFPESVNVHAIVDELELPDDSEIVEQRSAGEWAALVFKRAGHG